MKKKKKKKKKKKIFFVILISVTLGIPSFVYYFHDVIPGVMAIFELITGTGILGERKNDITLSIGGKQQKSRVYLAKLQRDMDTKQKENTIFLTDIPCITASGNVNNINFKVGLSYIGVFPDSKDLFFPTYWGLIAGECIETTFPLNDDMKGWNAKYSIIDAEDNLHYTIMPSNGNLFQIDFLIPKKYFFDGKISSPQVNAVHALPCQTRQK